MIPRFRAFDNADGDMVTDVFFSWQDCGYESLNECFSNDRWDFMLFTGQKDCGNSEIFDADILLEPWTGRIVGRVFYSLVDLAWKVLLVGGGEEYLSDCLDLQVCGNAYENPKLLEVSDDKKESG